MRGVRVWVCDGGGGCDGGEDVRVVTGVCESCDGGEGSGVRSYIITLRL